MTRAGHCVNVHCYYKIMAFLPHGNNLLVLEFWMKRQGLVHRRRLAQLYAAQERRRQEERRRHVERRRRVWVKRWLSEARRRQFSQYYTLHQELLVNDVPAFIRLTRFTPRMWHEIEERVTPHIQKQDTQMRLAIEPGLKLAITLRYLATGQTF